jgi:hypothetical protein
MLPSGVTTGRGVEATDGAAVDGGDPPAAEPAASTTVASPSGVGDGVGDDVTELEADKAATAVGPLPSGDMDDRDELDEATETGRSRGVATHGGNTATVCQAGGGADDLGAATDVGADEEDEEEEGRGRASDLSVAGNANKVSVGTSLRDLAQDGNTISGSATGS